MTSKKLLRIAMNSYHWLCLCPMKSKKVYPKEGEKSFWHPYFEIVYPSDLPCFWSKGEIDQLEDMDLTTDLIVYRHSFNEEWNCVERVYKMYPKYFTGL